VLVMSFPLAETLLDSRHFSSDGRLGYWTPAQVRRALLEWIPEKVTAPVEHLLDAPETLRTLLRYLDAHGLRDPRGAAVREKKARLVRRQGTRLVPVAKARPVLVDASALRQRAFEAAFDLGDAVCRPFWGG
jgi:hypothetical protein